MSCFDTLWWSKWTQAVTLSRHVLYCFSCVSTSHLWPFSHGNVIVIWSWNQAFRFIASLQSESHYHHFTPASWFMFYQNADETCSEEVNSVQQWIKRPWKEIAKTVCRGGRWCVFDQRNNIYPFDDNFFLRPSKFKISYPIYSHLYSNIRVEACHVRWNNCKLWRIRIHQEFNFFILYHTESFAFPAFK